MIDDTTRKVAELLHELGWRSPCDAQWTRLDEALPELRHVMGMPPYPPREHFKSWHWTPVTERLPQERGEYLTWAEQYGCCDVQMFDNGDFLAYGEIDRGVTHWMPLPETPHKPGGES